MLKNSVAVDINEYKCVFVVLRVVKCISVCIMLKSGALFLSKYMAAQMGISREKTATVKTLFNAQLDKILTPRVSSQKSRVIGLEVSTNSDKFKWMGSHLR